MSRISSPVRGALALAGAAAVVGALGAPSASAQSANTAAYSYDVAGAATLSTLTRGNVGINGSLDALLDLDTGDFTATTQVEPTRATLKAFGFLPVDAALSFTGAPIADNGADTVGNLSISTRQLTATTRQTINVSEANLFGINLVFDKRCRTETPSDITLASPEFNVLQGGQVSGTFAVGNLTECGFLTALLSPLTAGSGNKIVVNLTPAA